MADEFAKGLAILSGSGLVWMILAGWYQTPSFTGRQFTGARPSNPTFFQEIAFVVMDAALVFMLLGTLTFWVFVPLGREMRGRWAARGE